jgi:hypothetical protein
MSRLDMSGLGSPCPRLTIYVKNREVDLYEMNLINKIIPFLAQYFIHLIAVNKFETSNESQTIRFGYSFQR